jgi:N-acetylglucosamine malate deacetylase 1
MDRKINVLAFAAHPDDIEISISGIMLKHKASGLSTGIIDLTRGELGSRGSAEIRAQESAKASEIMGLDIRENLGLRDGFFEQNEESLMALVKVIRKYQPDIALINAESDRHPDHGRAHHLLKRACFLSGLIKIKTESEGKELEAWRPKAIYSYIQDYYLEPDIIIDVSDFWEQRMESLMAYSSQLYNPGSDVMQTPISSEEFLKNIEGRSYQLGRLINTRHAEGLRTTKPLGVHLLTDLV